MQNKREVMKSLLAASQYFEKTLPEAVVAIYIKALERYEDEQIFGAINKAVAVCRFFPRVAELIELIEGPKETQKDRAAIAWSKLIQAIEKQGSWKSVLFQDAPIMSVVRAMGGWERVCEWELEELNWKMKEFCELYSGLQHAQAPAYLPGTAERANIGAGHKTELPVLADGKGERVLPMPQHTDADILKQIAERAGL